MISDADLSKISEGHCHAFLPDIANVRDALRKDNVCRLYPNFDKWYYETFYRGLSKGERFIHIERNLSGNVIGFLIVKCSHHEKKLCTFWVAQHFRDSGIGLKLSRIAFELLGTNKPLFTVPEERLSDFRGLLNIWNFGEAIKHHDCYRHGKIEFVFNGTL